MKLAYNLLGIDLVENLKEELLPLLRAEEGVLSLDMQEVNKIDLSAIQLLISLQKSLLVQIASLVDSAVNSIALSDEILQKDHSLQKQIKHYFEKLQGGRGSQNCNTRDTNKSF